MSRAAGASRRSPSRSASSPRSRSSTSEAARDSRGSTSRSASSRRSRRSTFPAEEEKPTSRGRLVINSARRSFWASRLYHRQQQKQQYRCFTTPPGLRKCRLAFACRTPLRTHISIVAVERTEETSERHNGASSYLSQETKRKMTPDTIPCS
jgi:hypothetical protein